MKIARTFLPFNNTVNENGETSLTDLDKQFDRSVLPTNNVTTIQDIVFDGRKYKLPGGGGDWSSGDESQPGSYKSKGSDYKNKEEYLEGLRRQRDQGLLDKMLGGGPLRHEEWKVVMKGGTVSFPSFPIAQKYKEKVKQKYGYEGYISRVAQVQNKIHVIADALDKTFLVSSIDFNNSVQETGSAFCVGKGVFLTCAHVIEKYDKNNIQSVNRFGKTRVIRISNEDRFYNASIIDYDLELDIAILEADVEDVEPFEISNSFEVGQDIVSIGSPHGFENNVSQGIIGSVGKKVYRYKNAPYYMFIDADIHPGNSGGPIVDLGSGKVVGLVTLIVSQEGMYGLNAALPASYIVDFLSKNNI
jgi:S1-C subfamily serine protease